MKVITHTCGTRFTVTPDNEADQALIDALDFERTVHVIDVMRSPSASGGYVADCVTLEVSRASPAALEAQAGREALCALRKVISLGLGEPAGHRHVGANAANPQPQKELAASLEKLDLMLKALGEVVCQQGAVLKEMNRAHSASASSESAIVVAAEQGGAA